MIEMMIYSLEVEYCMQYAIFEIMCTQNNSQYVGRYLLTSLERERGKQTSLVAWISLLSHTDSPTV